ncbi:hypothetical protein HG530_000133 [Fusarium avenaceum]|nr:hypothetical protein HG530_000133 [Fusarium avenaceum]
MWLRQDVLALLLFELPEVVSLFALEVTLLHGNVTKSFLNTFTHTLTASTYKDAAVQRVDDVPDQIRLVHNLLFHVGSATEVGEDASALVGTKVHKNLLFVGSSGVLSNYAEKLLGWSIGLNIGGPGEELTAGSDEFSGLLVAPDSGPAALGGLHENRLITLEARDHKSVEDFIHRNFIVGGHDANGTTDLEVEDLLWRIVGNIEVEMESSLLGTRLSELASVVNPGWVNIMGRLFFDEEAEEAGSESEPRDTAESVGEEVGRGIEVSWDVLESETQRLEGIVVRQCDLLVLDIVSIAHAASSTTAAPHILSWCLTSDSLNIPGILSNQACGCTAAALERNDGLVFLGVGIV